MNPFYAHYENLENDLFDEFNYGNDDSLLKGSSFNGLEDCRNNCEASTRCKFFAR